MNKKRNRLEIIYDILRVINEKNGRIKPTHILYKSNLSHQMLEEYLSELITKEFVSVAVDRNNRKTYSLTEKGFQYISKYKSMMEFMDSFGLSEDAA